MKVCEYPECSRPALYFMGWNNENGKHFGLVCPVHDTTLGRKNLVNAGMPTQEIPQFEDYCERTAKLQDYPDWHGWGTQSHPIALLKLSPGAQNALRRYGILTIKELLNLSSDELSKIRTLGVTRIHEIKERLKEYLTDGEVSSLAWGKSHTNPYVRCVDCGKQLYIRRYLTQKEPDKEPRCMKCTYYK